MLDIIVSILGIMIFIWFFCGLIWLIDCSMTSNDIKSIIHKYFFIEKFKSGNWFGKILIVLLIIILLPYTILGIILFSIGLICSEVYSLIQKIGGWNK